MFVVQPNLNPRTPGAGEDVPASSTRRSGTLPRGSEASRSGSRPEFQLPPATEKADPAAASGMERLSSALSALGMNAAGLDIKYSEELVWYPGGSYVNRLITVTSGSRSESFSADLTARNPYVTAHEIQKYLGVPGNTFKLDA